MVMKNDGRKRKKGHDIINCPYCGTKIDVNEAIEEGYIQKAYSINVCDCPKCDKQFNY